MTKKIETENIEMGQYMGKAFSKYCVPKLLHLSSVMDQLILLKERKTGKINENILNVYKQRLYLNEI